MTIREYIDKAINSGNKVTIKYVKFDGSLSTRTISELEYSDEFGDDYISAFCHMRQERRTFKISRIREIDGISSTIETRTVGVVKTAYNPQSSSSIGGNNSKSSYSTTNGIFASLPKFADNNSKSSYSTTNTQQINVVTPHSVNISTSSNSNSSTQKRSEGCYIATMAYGDYNHPKVMVLRRYRDNILAKSTYGRAFIKTYYWLSPKLVKILSNHKRINSIIRCLLDKVVEKLSV